MQVFTTTRINKQKQENNVYRALGAGRIHAKCVGCRTPLTPPAREAAFSHPDLYSQGGLPLQNRLMGPSAQLASVTAEEKKKTKEKEDLDIRPPCGVASQQ